MVDDSPFTTDTKSPSGDGPDTSDEQTATEDLHRLLTSERRRRLLSYLSAEADRPVAVDELVTVVAEREQPDPGPATHRVRVTTDLHHVQLPALADAGVVEYDPVAETVSYDGSERVESLLAASAAVDGTE